MALIVCPECGRKVSDKAAACPQCGYPISEIGEIAEEVSQSRHSDAKRKNDPADATIVKDPERSALPSEDEYVNVNGYSMEELYPERFSDSKAGGKDKTKNTGGRTAAAHNKQTAPRSQAVTYEKSNARARYTGTIYDYKPVATKHHILSKLAFIFIWIPGLCIVGLILAIIDLKRNREYRHGLSYAAIIIFAGIFFVIFSLYRMRIKAVERENAARNRTTVTDNVDRTKEKAPKEDTEVYTDEKLPYDFIFDEE
ncbi:MAG: zinc-ribbon domain-containing protein [Lachnospiraceae bacterium]|nr:zinc-ribbon domain-containing protein [Lachnospiraceae bacterium]